MQREKERVELIFVPVRIGVEVGGDISRCLAASSHPAVASLSGSRGLLVPHASPEL